MTCVNFTLYRAHLIQLRIQRNMSLRNSSVETASLFIYAIMFYRQEEAKANLLGRDGGNETEMSQMDSLLKERNQLNEIGSQLDDFIASAQASHASLVRQNDIVRGTKQKMLQVGEKIGVSKELLRKIDKTQQFDKYLVYGCIALTLFIFFFLRFGIRIIWSLMSSDVPEPDIAVPPS